MESRWREPVRCGILRADMRPTNPTRKTELRDRFCGALLGLAVGDALGTTVEFQPRGSFAPLTDMVGGGPFNLKAGCWTDDTATALCLATSLLERDGFDARDQMERYCRWWKDGYLSSTGRCFDIGGTVAAALRRFRDMGEPVAGSTDPNSAGNGCIMRLAPVPMFYFPDEDAAARFSGESSRTTHGAAECVDACRLMARMLVRALPGPDEGRGRAGRRGEFCRVAPNRGHCPRRVFGQNGGADSRIGLRRRMPGGGAVVLHANGEFRGGGAEGGEPG